MPVTTLSSREFNHDVGRAKRGAEHGPVFITNRGQASHVLLSIAAYRKLTGQAGDFLERLGSPAGVEAVEVAFPRSRSTPRPADFS